MVANGKCIVKASKTSIYQEKLANDMSNNIMKMVLMVNFQTIQIVAEKSYLTEKQLKEIITGNEEKYNLK